MDPKFLPIIPKMAADLLLTIRWTEYLYARAQPGVIDYVEIFRHTNIQYEGAPFYQFNPSAAITNFDKLDYYPVLDKAMAARAECKYPVNKSKVKDYGRILLFETYLTTIDGVAEAESGGLFDETDVPPIDTWFYLVEYFWRTDHPVLMSWIPSDFVPLAQGGIDVEIFDSYAWLDEVDKELNDELFKAIKNLE